MPKDTSDKVESRPKPQNGQAKKSTKTTLKEKVRGCKNTCSVILKFIILIFGIIKNAEDQIRNKISTHHSNHPQPSIKTILLSLLHHKRANTLSSTQLEKWHHR